MNLHDLRQKYPNFIFEKYEYDFVGDRLEIKFYYSIPPDHKFTHKLLIENCLPVGALAKSGKLKNENLENLIFHVGLSLIPSYWKATCSPVIQLSTLNCQLSTEQVSFWKKLFLNGMGEYFYKNQIDFTDPGFLAINTSTSNNPVTTSSQSVTTSDKILVPIGGGKDSIVTLELLKNHFTVIPFIINPVPIMYEVIKTAGINEYIEVQSQIDPHLLELNKQGYLNGHTPISAFYAFTSVLTAYLINTPFIAFSNERSSNEGNTTYLGHEINHQYSKSLEFESDLNKYLKANDQRLTTISYFSFLRPLYELQITKLFSRYPQYFNVFSSCNQNFKLSTINSQLSTKWCSHCPKCVSTALMLACFIGKEKVSEIMGSYPPDLPINQSLINQLTGKSSVKPFECVLTRAEASAAYNAIELGQLDQLGQLLSSWMDNPNLPEKFVKILKAML